MYVDGKSATFRTHLMDSDTYPWLSIAQRHGQRQTTAPGIHGYVQNAFMYTKVLSFEELQYIRTFTPQASVPAPGAWGYGLQFNGGAIPDCQCSGML